MPQVEDVVPLSDAGLVESVAHFRGHAIWVCPDLDEQAFKEALAAVSDSTAASDGLRFAKWPPHITLVAGINAGPDGTPPDIELAELTRVASEIAASTAPFVVELDEVWVDAVGEPPAIRYFPEQFLQGCYFYAADAPGGDPMRSVRDRVLAALGRDPPSNFRPHLSLAYWDGWTELYARGARDRLASAVRDAGSLAPRSFQVQAIHVVSVHGLVNEWTKLTTHDLIGPAPGEGGGAAGDNPR